MTKLRYSPFSLSSLRLSSLGLSSLGLSSLGLSSLGLLASFWGASVLGAAALGCTGEIGTNQGVTGKAPPGTESPLPNSPISEPVAGCATLGPSPLTRLSAKQIANSVQDLLGVEVDHAVLRPADELNGAFISNSRVPIGELLAEQYQGVAAQAARAAVTNLATLVPCTTQDAACAQTFIEGFGLRAYRRPLAADEVARYLNLFAVGQTFSDGVRLMIEAALQSPHFLYRVEPDAGLSPGSTLAPGSTRALNSYEVATRLSFALTNSIPDAELMEAARQGQLTIPESVLGHAGRLLASPKAAEAISDFHSQWLHLEELDRLTKDSELFPEFTAEVATAMSRETARFTDHVVRSGDGRLATLFTASFSFLDGPLFELYGVPEPAGHDPLTPVQLNPLERSGLLTHAGVLSVAADSDQGSPIRRGVLIREHVMCQDLPTPPPDVEAGAPEVDQDSTTRERFAQHREDPACASCHSLIDPIGFGFENYDAIGRYRATEAGSPIDASGQINGQDGVVASFVGARELSEQLAASDVVRQCLARQWFRYLFARPQHQDDSCAIDAGYERFSQSDYNIRELILGMVASRAFSHMRGEP